MNKSSSVEMGNSLEQHRAAIGLFNARSRTKREAPDWWVETPTWSAFRLASLQNANATGKEVSFLKTYCSRNFWPNALKPTTSISSVLLQHANSREAVLPTHLLMTAPTSDITNLLHMGTSARMNLVDISVKSMIVTVEMCLIHHPGLQKVFIMEHLPR